MGGGEGVGVPPELLSLSLPPLLLCSDIVGRGVGGGGVWVPGGGGVGVGGEVGVEVGVVA